jgi:hypothetical protein
VTDPNSQWRRGCTTSEAIFRAVDQFITLWDLRQRYEIILEMIAHKKS